MMAQKLRGVIAATPTPIRNDLSIDTELLIDHCRWLLGPGGCDGVNLLGTTGEATSFSIEQRLATMNAIASAKLPLDRMMVGTGASALQDAVSLTAAARDLGFAGALLVPPFYYKGIDGGALADFVETLLNRAGTNGLRLYLYHIPQNTGVPYPLETVARLRDKFPETIVGLKDSAGDIANSRQLAAGLVDFDVFPGSEATLGEARQSHFAGCISATTNITGALARKAWLNPESDEGLGALIDAAAIRAALATLPLVCSVKWAVSDLRGIRSWNRPHTPLRPLSAVEVEGLAAALGKVGYYTLKSMHHAAIPAAVNG